MWSPTLEVFNPAKDAYERVAKGLKGELNRQKILQSAIDTYGMFSQLGMAIEEMSELTKAICKYKRLDLVDVDTVKMQECVANILEETADVQIMLDQIRSIFGSTAEQEQYKLERLARKLNHNV